MLRRHRGWDAHPLAYPRLPERTLHRRRPATALWPNRVVAESGESSMTAVAILIPALNEEQTIASVVHAFRESCPEGRIIVFDNASTDDTAARARAAGAEVRFEARRGKGNVVQTMFRTIDADVYVMVDGDSTYPPDRIGDLVRPIVEGDADMVIGSRLLRGNSEFRPLNLMGNRFYAALLRSLFGVRITDL